MHYVVVVTIVENIGREFVVIYILLKFQLQGGVAEIKKNNSSQTVVIIDRPNLVAKLINLMQIFFDSTHKLFVLKNCRKCHK